MRRDVAREPKDAEKWAWRAQLVSGKLALGYFGWRASISSRLGKLDSRSRWYDKAVSVPVLAHALMLVVRSKPNSRGIEGIVTLIDADPAREYADILDVIENIKYRSFSYMSDVPCQSSQMPACECNW